jgi:hypothetical protein
MRASTTGRVVRPEDDGYLALEYVWLEWEHCHECDNLAETILLRDRLLAALAGSTWMYPDVG